MDPLSVTSGIVGIVAFALELAKTASKVKKAVEEVRSAPKVARELIERLVMLETACQLIGFHLERRDTPPGHSSSASLDIISKALAQCLVRIQDLEQVVSLSGPGDSAAGTPLPKFDTASRLRLVLRREKISSLIQEIDRVISLLQFVIQVDMWTMTATPLRLLSPSNHGSQLTGKSSKPMESSNSMLVNCDSSQSIVPRNGRQAMNQRRHTSQYMGCIAWTIADGRTGHDNNDDSLAYRKGSITFRLPFTTTQLSMHYVSGMGAPSYALNVTHIIEDRSELGRRLWGLISPRSELKELHKMISGGELSIYSVFRSQSRETNIYFLAVGMRWAEGCKYLLQHDYRHQFEQEETPDYFGNAILPTFGHTCEITDTILSRRPDDMREMDIKYLLETGSHPEYFGRYLKVFLDSPGINHSDMLSHAWTCVVGEILSVEWRSYKLDSWIPPLRYLIEQGVDVHQPYYGPDSSAYLTIVTTTRHPLIADDNARSWLEMLKVCGVELRGYLEAETTLAKRAGVYQLPTERQREIVIIDFGGLQMPSWRWKPVTESSIAEVLEEFGNLGYDRIGYLTHIPCPSGPDDFECWKAENISSGWGKDCFPFLWSPLDCVRDVHGESLDGTWLRETYKRAVEIRDKRIARRQAKKWRKAHPGQKPPSNKMPGTWVD